MTPVDLAATMLGKREAPDRAAIQDYLKTGGANLDPATTAWCAAFVNSTLAQSGFKGTGSNLARSFLNYGQAVDKPTRGDIAVYSRGDPKGMFGHVGFVDAVNPDGTVKLLAGNQGDAVTSKTYGTGNLLGYRRPGAPGSAPTGSPGMTSAMSPTPMGQQQTALGPRPTAFGDLVAPNVVQTTAVEPQQMFGDLIATQMQARQDRQTKQAELEAADQQRKAALFGGSLFGPYA